MPSADLREIMRFKTRRGPRGKAWMDGQFRDRKFVLFQGKDGDWTMYERIGLAEPQQPEAAERSSPRPGARAAPRKLQRELGALGLIDVCDVVVEAPDRLRR